VKVETETDLPAVTGDSIHLEQVITNLAMNAMDAMPGGGTLTITTSTMEIRAPSSPIRPFLAPGKYVSSRCGYGTGILRRSGAAYLSPSSQRSRSAGTGLGLPWYTVS